MSMYCGTYDDLCRKFDSVCESIELAEEMNATEDEIDELKQIAKGIEVAMYSAADIYSDYEVQCLCVGGAI